VVQILHGGLQIGNLLSEAIILATLHLKLVFYVGEPISLHLDLSVEVETLVVFLFEQLFEPVDFHFANVDFVLVLLNLNFGFLVNFFLRRGHTVQLLTHLFDLFGLRVINVRLS